MSKENLAYLFGALHGDGYVYTGKSKGKVAVFTQKNRSWLENIKKIIKQEGANSWIFKQRNIHVLETKFKLLLQNFDINLLNNSEQIQYVTGFFDAEGGIPLNPEKSSFFYIQFVQKNKGRLELIKKILENNEIECGITHQYDKKKSKCWRFFIRRSSFSKFVETIKSRHPSKIERFEKFKQMNDNLEDFHCARS